MKPQLQIASGNAMHSRSKYKVPQTHFENLLRVQINQTERLNYEISELVMRIIKCLGFCFNRGVNILATLNCLCSISRFMIQV